MTGDRASALADHYVKRLLWALQPLPHDDRLAIAGEIHSHLVDAGHGSESATEQAVARLGPPDRLARAYIEDFELAGAVNRAAPGPLLASMLRRGSRNLVAFAAGSAGALCYLFAGAFAIIAAAKLVAPGSVGFWFRGDTPVTFGLLANADIPSGREVLGWTIVPIAALVAVAAYMAGGALLRRAARRLLARG